MGWAISKTYCLHSLFQESQRVSDGKFVIGERNGGNADPTQVEKDMRTARNPSNECQFSSTEWLTKTQIQGFFSRLAASRRKEQGLLGMSVETEKM